LKKKLEIVLKGSPAAGVTADKISESRMEDEEVAEAPVMRTARAPQPRASTPVDEDDDDTLSYFANLAKD
jgi:hypothetical protein